MYDFRVAQEGDITRILDIMQQAKEQMYREKKQQWDDSYPAFEHIAADINKGYGHVLCNNTGVIVAYAAVVYDGEPAYEVIKGKWLSLLPFVVVHRMAVADEIKGQGISALLMNEVEKMSIEKGVRSFKIDTNFDNIRMQRVLEKCGFTHCGEIYYEKGSRLAYEKLL